MASYRHVAPKMEMLGPWMGVRYGEDFARAMRFVLRWEKEISTEHGEVVAIWGIDKRWHHPAFTTLTTLFGPARLQWAVSYYHKTFWLPVGALTPFVLERIFLFDTAVNQGMSVARAIMSPPVILSQIALRRIQRYTELAGSHARRPFLLGWLRRVFALLDELTVKD